MNKSALIITAAALLAFAPQAYAAGNCEIIYGGGEVCPPSLNFTINKTVQAPNKGGSYVDNLGVNDAKYAPTNTINFQVEIKNTGNKRIEKIEVTDELPQYLTFVQGVGTYNKDTRKLTFTVNNLDPDKSVAYTIVTKAAEAKDLPSDSGVICVTNHVRAVADNNSTAGDNASVCIEKQVLGTTPKVYPGSKAYTTPATGPESLAIIGLIPTGLAGFFLRRRSL